MINFYNGWTFLLYRLYIHLQTRLHITLRQDNDRLWGKTTAQTVTTHNDPATIWRRVKNLMGTDSSSVHYLVTKTITKYSKIKIKRPCTENTGETYLQMKRKTS